MGNQTNDDLFEPGKSKTKLKKTNNNNNNNKTTRL